MPVPQDNNRPTVIDDCEVFDSDGTLALQVDGHDVLYLSRVKPDEDQKDFPILTDEQHQRIIDVICEALKTGERHES